MSIVPGGVTHGKVEILKHRDGLTHIKKDNLCRTIVDGCMKQGKRAGATLDAVHEEKVILRCVANVTDKELPWSAV